MKSLRVAVVAALLMNGCARTPETVSPLVRLAPGCAQQDVRLTIVGDSLARGWGASVPQNSFASLIYDDVRRRFPKTTMRNLGIPGATSDEIARAEVGRIERDECSLVVIVSGANDVQRLYTPRHFRASYTKLLGAIRARVPHAAVVVIGLPDVSLSPRIPWFLKPFESRLSKDGSASIAEAAREYGAAFVPLYDLSREEAYRSQSLLSADGIHPNDAGYRIMAAAVWAQISTSSILSNGVTLFGR